MKKLIAAALKLDLPMRDIKNANTVNLWMLLWAATFVGADLMIEFTNDWYYFIEIMLLAIALHLGATIVMILKFKRLLKQLDEMEKKIQLDAIALAAGAALAGCSVGSILDNSNLIASVDTNSIIIILCFTYMCALIVGRIRLR
ncbi:MAG: hypothetical protein OSB23_03005 [Porticoccaceae bacterium]|nr:hypothetical protein [Porticoccaceae bacterium]|tara:strand:- start:10079 stop:10510 length:432 start_codon:yes stop_codon:yes gene_type:complete